MKIGQTSIIVFTAKLLGSVFGFIATLYFARKLGAEVIGLYTLVLTVVGWSLVVSRLGFGKAMIKRISEGEEKGEYLSAAIILSFALAIFISVLIFLSRPFIEGYIGEFNQYVAVSVIWFIIAIIMVRLFRGTVFRVLNGEQKVHISGLLEPVKVGGKSLIQIALVFAGFGLFGMLVGYILGGILVGILGLLWVSTRPALPAKRHFISLLDFAKYSWLGSFESRTFKESDILILGIFVPTALVGVYSIAWSLAKFLDLFGSAIKSTVFPEISFTSTQDNRQAVAGMIEDAIAYTGLIAIPGLVGGVILAERLLQLYGDEFVEGTAVLGLLILAVLVYSYKKQMLNGLNGIDRPDLAFRINTVFIVVNVGLNLVLIWQLGIEGAAIASALSATLGAVLAYYMLSTLVTFTVPYREIARQWAAAFVMGIIVWSGLNGIESTGILQNNAIIVISLVGLGAGIYFIILLIISSRFRTTVDRNLPVDLPFIS